MSTLRQCSRCGQKLTDAASLECGVDPICRGIDNEVLAHVFPVDHAGVEAAARALLADLGRVAPETTDTLASVATTLFGGVAPNSDNRATVKRLDWACSFTHPEPKVRATCLALMKALGYWGLAAIIEGQASTSAAEVSAVDGRVVVKAVKNKAAAMAFKEVKGWKFDHTAKVWSFPWTMAAHVEGRLNTFYPASKFDMATIAETAKSQMSEVAKKDFAPAVTAPIAKVMFLGCEIAVKAAVTVTVEGDKLRVKTPFVAAFVAELKMLPYKDRAWNLPEAPGVWTVAAKHAKYVATLLAKHYPLAQAA